MSAHVYKHIIDQFLSRTVDAETFICLYSSQWRHDRDNGNAALHALKLQRLLDSIFTSCDRYDKTPEGSFEISEEALRHEVGLLRYVWWG